MKNTLFTTFLVNRVSGKVRVDSLNGRPHLVAPVTMIVPGVLNGSKGPIYYSGDENKKSFHKWNGMPIVLTHPKVAGKYVSARQPEILNSHGMGQVLNAKVTAKGELKAEAWFDVEQTNLLAPGLTNKIEMGQKVELSTGILKFKAIPATEGNSVFNGTDFTHEAVDLDPDHLAILLNEEGACSIAGGCGVNNQQEKEKGTMKETEFFVTNTSMSHENLRSAISRALKSNFKQDEPRAWISEVHDTFVIYEHSEKLFKAAYTVSSTDEITLSSPQEVRREEEVSYIPVTNEEKKTMTTATPTKSETDFNRDTVINGLIVNCACWTEDSRELLNSASDDQLKVFGIEAAKDIKRAKVADAAEKSGLVLNAEGQLIPKVDPEETGKAENESEGAIVNNAGLGMGEVAQTTEQFMASLPPEVQQTLKAAEVLVANAKAESDAAKEIVINRLTESIEDSDQKAAKAEELKALDLSVLNSFADLLPKPEVNHGLPTPNFAAANGRATSVSNSTSVAVPLEVPYYGFE